MSYIILTRDLNDGRRPIIELASLGHTANSEYISWK